MKAAVDQAGRDGPGLEIAGLTVVGQMHGAVLTDPDGGPLRPAIVWLDRRSSAEVEDYRRLPEPLRSALGNPPSPGMAGPTLLWLSRHEPETYRRARWLFQPKDWLRLRLTGKPAADPTDASGTLLYDLGRGRWATEVAGALGLRGDLLPPLRPPAAIAGNLQPGAAARLGLPAGLPVATGAADTAASVLAAALPGPGWCLLTLGTGGQWVVPVIDADSAGGSRSERADQRVRRGRPRGLPARRRPERGHHAGLGELDPADELGRAVRDRGRPVAAGHAAVPALPGR